MRSSKKFILLIISAVLLISILTYVSALANPATVYCEEMNNEFGGYDYQIKVDENGNQYGVCVVSGEEYEEWAFLKGKVGEEDSYCVKKGYGIKTVNENENEYAVCIVPKSEVIESDGKMSALSSEESGEQEVSMEELMNLGEKVAARGSLTFKQGVSSESEEGKRLMSSFQEQRSLVSLTYNQGDYSSWDWRSPPSSTQYASSKYTFFDTVRGWMTSIKDQASCGSCWSFSSHGSVEAKYNIERNNSRLNPDLSEQNSVSCDHGCYVGYSWPDDAGNGCQGDCSTGGYMDLALKYFKNTGTVDESCFPYTSGIAGDVGDCSDKCSDSSSRLWTVGNYNTTWPEGGTQLWLTNNQTKQWLIDNGPMIAGIYASDLLGTSGIIERCTNDSKSPNHAVVLVGYNDTGTISTSYWILKNSWGTGWGDEGSGYFKLGFNECNFTSEFEYGVNVTAPNFKPSITLNSPSNDNVTGNTLASFNFSVSNRVYLNSTCDLIINNITRNTTALAINGTSTILTYNLSNGQHNWSINCWENGLGIVNSSETRAVTTDATAPVVHLISPRNNIFRNFENTSHLFNVTDDSGPANCTFFWNDFSPSNSNSQYPTSVDGSEQDAGNLTSSDGNVTWTINCTDSAGNTGAGEIWTYTVDTIYPTIDFESDTTSSGNHSQNWIYVNLTVNDTNFNETFIYMYNSTEIIITVEELAAKSFAWNSSSITNLSDGTYYFNATTYDLVGNRNNTATRMVVLDKTPPVVTITSISNNTRLGATNLPYNLTGNVSDNIMGVNFTSFYQNGILNKSTVDNSNPGLFWSQSWNPTDGIYNLTIQSCDLLNNCANASVYNITIDRIYPTINFTSPTETSGLTNTTRNYILVNVTANDTNLVNITIRLYNSTGLRNSTNSSTSSLYINFSSLADGTYYFNATACDILNNCNNTETRNFTIDVNPPIITINSPALNSYYRSVIFNVTLNENGSTCLYSIDRGANKTMSPSADNRNFNATNASMSEAAHNVTFSCNDSYGNMNSTTSRTFYFDITEPEVALISPVDESNTHTEDTSVSFKYNVTDSSPIDYCTIFVDDVANENDTSVDHTGDDETIAHIFSSSGDYHWFVRCYDEAGNDADSSEEWTIDIQAAANNNDGGSGSSTTTGTEYTASNSALSSGYTKQLRKGEVIKFTFSNDSSGTHRMTLDSLSNDRAYVTITSSPISLTLVPGKEKKINVSSSTYYQLSIKLNSIVNNKANITIKEINERIDGTNTPGSTINNGSANQTGGNTTGGNDGWANEKIDNIRKTVSNIFSNKYVLIGVGVLIVAGVVCLVWYVRMKIRKKKGWDK